MVEKSKTFRIDPIEEALYEQAASEITGGQIRQGLWLKATVESDGDDFKARTIYTQYRVAQLMAELAEELAHKSAAKAQVAAKLAREQEEEIERQRKIKHAQWREKHFKSVEYSPQEQTRLKKQNTIALAILVSVFTFLLAWALTQIA